MSAQTHAKLSHLPAGWTLANDGTAPGALKEFRRPCSDGMFVKIVEASDGTGWVVVRCYPEGNAQCGGFYPSWKKVREACAKAEREDAETAAV